MALTAQLVRIEMRHASPARYAGQTQGVIQFKVRMRFQERSDGFFILYMIIGTSGINHRAAALEAARSAFKDFQLALMAHLRRILTPLRDRVRVAAEHPLPGAGRVHQHRIKPRAEGRGNAGRLFIEHHSVGHAHALYVFQQDAGAHRVNLIGDEYAFPRKMIRDLRALAARRRAQIEHPHAGLHAQRFHRCHSGRLLQIIRPRCVQRFFAHAQAVRHVVSRPAPGNRLKIRVRLPALAGADAQTDAAFFIISRKESRRIGAQLSFHLLHKSARQFFHALLLRPQRLPPTLSRSTPSAFSSSSLFSTFG